MASKAPARVSSAVSKSTASISARTNERALLQQAYSSDPKYKKYTQQVEKCLNSFDNVHEWADCIAFLKQLLKTFQSYMQFKEIPRKLVVAKRLAQCLNPALPTGVHQRALEVYSHILAVLGGEGLNKDLVLWSSGLFPFFEYSATSVKPTLLNLYDTYYLPLQANLRPIMKSFILALLPGLEEETGEFFEKVLGLLDRLSGTVSPSFFFQNIWLVMLTTPSGRGTSLNFLSRRLPRLNADEDISSIVGRDIGLMIRAFSAALEDDNLLVRRSALDLLLQSIKVDSAAVKNAQAEDRTILMRAATGVVLRRDLSLNRRLYTWLLGPAEKSDLQLAYFRENALELLKLTLKDEMFSPSGEYSESRPFKIFISLLDKWEIGSPLTEVLVYDAFRAIKQLLESGGADDVIMTASTLYEAVEPNIIWKQLLTSIVSEATDVTTDLEAIRLTTFILKTFSIQEEETQTIHLPIVFSAIIDIINVRLQEDITRTSHSSILESLLLAEEILRHIPRAGLSQRPELTSEMQATSRSQSPYAFACTFYGIASSTESLTRQGPFDVPLASALENIITIILNCAHGLFGSSCEPSPLRDVFSQSLVLLDTLVDRINTSIDVSWDPLKWLHVVLATMNHEAANFTMIDRLITLVITLHQTNGLLPKLSIDDLPVMHKMVNKLLGYLRPHHAVYHVRSVVLIWSLEKAVNRPHVESIVAQSMTSSEYRHIQESYEVFGVLWRLSEDNLLPGFKFKVPMMIVLDTLKNDNPSLRRVSETWMRCSLKSYLRILDPILYDLLDPTVRWVPTINEVRGKELQGFTYERAFDLRYLNHLLEILLSVVRFGGQGFIKAARSTPVRRSPHNGLIKRIESVGFPDVETTYMEVLVETLLRYLLSEPKPALSRTLQSLNILIQSTSVDLLQAVVSRGDANPLSVAIVESAVIDKLFYCIHTCRLDLQNKLLHLLHSVISASLSNLESSKPKQPIVGQRQIDGLPEDAYAQENPPDSGTRAHEVNPLLTQTLVDGIATPTNRPVIQHWLDFVLMAVPQFQPAMEAVITPLNDCLCRQLLATLEDVRQASAKNAIGVEDITSTATDAEMIMFLNGLERIILLSLARSSDSSHVEDETNTVEKTAQESSGLLGYVSNVFSSDSNTTPTEDQLTSRSAGYRSLHEGVRVLLCIWSATSWSKPQVWSPKDDSLSLIYNRTRVRCRRVLEHLFQVQSAEVFESIVDCWNRDVSPSKTNDTAAFELVDVLISSAQTAVHMICESISCRMSGISEKNKKQAINPNLSDAVLFRFLEQYMQRLEGPLALQVWGRFLQLVKDVIGSRDFKAQTFYTLRSLSVLAEKITQTTAMDDRRVRKELQDNFGKLLDSCILYVGRSSDQGNWIRRSTKDALAMNGRDSPAPRDSKLDEKTDANSPSLQDTLKPVAGPELISQINNFVATIALPNLRKFLVESDKVLSMCSNIVYYMVNPAMKGKSKPIDADDMVIEIITEMSKIPAALKAWRAPVAELLNDNRLFNCHSDAAAKWKPVVKTLFEADKSALTELLAKVATAPSTTIFTNREYELLLRSLNVRRLSFVLLTGDKNQFITNLPSIQEKLVDILRNVSAPIVQSEVYLCIRVLLCRLSPHNLTSFWPVILTELYRIFEQAMTALPSDGSEDLQLLFAACKCLDLLLVLQTEEFQIHQWIFITDTVDAVYHPDNWFPAAMIDQLAEVANSIPVPDGTREPSASSIGPPVDPELHTAAWQRPLRQPLLNSVRQVESIRDLVPFFTHVSLTSYESVYASGGNIDWESVERGLMEDMFDGR